MTDAIALEDQLAAIQQGDLREEASWRSRAAEHLSEREVILESLAQGNLASFQWQVARDYSETILRRNPNDAQALWLRGRACVEMQQEDLALDDFEKAVDIAPENFSFRSALAELLHTLGYARKAMEQYAILRKLSPNDEQPIIGMAKCWQDEAMLSAAKELLDGLLSQRPKSMNGLVERSKLALRMGEAQAALRWIHLAIEQNPDHLDVNRALRTALTALKRNDAATNLRIAQLDSQQATLKLRLHETQPDAELLSEVGKWMMRTGQTSEVTGWFYSALAKKPDHAPAHMGLAKFFDHSGQTRRAHLHARLGLDAARSNRTSESSVRLSPLEDLTHVEISPESATEASHEDVQRLCAACHAYPPPESMPRSAWRKEVKQGFDFLYASAIEGQYPSLESVVRYYERRAPEKLAEVIPHAISHTAPVKFAKRGTGYLPQVPPQPGIAHANLANLFAGPQQELLLCDTKLDSILVLRPYDEGPGGMALRQLTAPCHTTVGDLDRDGRQDVIVASLGNFFPTDDKVGKVHWLRAGSNGQYEPKTILDGVGRVSDVQIADFNSDGRLDLVVAVFGWRSSGEILFVENQTTDWSKPQFVPHVVDSRHGAIHVPVVDMDRDGKPDFVGLISQEHETIVCYRNLGNGTFEQFTVFTAPHPTYGCSGIEIVDLDGDRDSDVVLTNGDILDRPYLLKPYHGVQWLENEGKYPFKHHRLADMPGAARATAADFDGDGDQDIAAVSLLPATHFPERDRLQLPSLMLIEQRSKSQFQIHVLETGTCDHFSCAAGDWDHDGRIDLAVANFAWNGSPPMVDAATLWKNLGPQK